MKLTVNGEARDVTEGLTLSELVQGLALESERVAVEVNAIVIRRAEHASFRLSPGDAVEIVTFVGGG